MAQMPYMARPQGCLKANVGQSIESIDGFWLFYSIAQGASGMGTSLASLGSPCEVDCY